MCFLSERAPSLRARCAVLSIASMIQIPKLLGLGDNDNARKITKDFLVFALCFGLLMTLSLFASRDGIIDSFANNAEVDGLREKLVPLWPLIALYQVPRAMIAVFGPQASAWQLYIFWGKTSALCFFCVWLPLALLGLANNNLFLAILARVMYDGMQALLLGYRIFIVEFRASKGGTGKAATVRRKSIDKRAVVPLPDAGVQEVA